MSKQQQAAIELAAFAIEMLPPHIDRRLRILQAIIDATPSTHEVCRRAALLHAQLEDHVNTTKLTQAEMLTIMQQSKNKNGQP